MAIASLASHPFTLRQLQYAVAVAESLSFRKAADLCHVSQPSLSTQLGQLENALGVRLFERDQRRVLVTAAGEEVLERARRLLLEADDLGAAAARAGDPLTGTLRIGVIPTISPYLLPSVTPALHTCYPRLTTVWVEDKTEPLVRALHAGTLDAALLALEAPVGDVEHETVALDPFVLATRPDDPLGTKPAPARAAELRDVPLLLLDDGHCFRDQALAFCAGATILPALAVATETQRARLSIRAFASPPPHRTIALCWRKRSPLAAAMKRLGVTIRDAYPGRPTGGAVADSRRGAGPKSRQRR